MSRSLPAAQPTQRVPAARPDSSPAHTHRGQPRAPGGALALLTAHGLHPVPATGRVVVGSGPQAQCRLPAPRVAARHCLVERGAGGDLWVTDLRTDAGTWLRGRRVERAPLKEGDALLVGREAVLVVRVGTEGWPDAVRWRGLIARASVSLEALTTIGRLGPHELPVLVHGESGVGKELVARALHAVSARAEGPWVAVNCAALTDTLAEATLFGVRRGAFTGATADRRGVFEEAHGGTLLLDEVGELSPALQAKLLRALEAGEVTRVGEVHPRSVDVRVVAATWRDLGAEAASGGFRHDLLHRLAVLRLEVPPLRARPADVGPLYDHFRRTAGLGAPPGPRQLGPHALGELASRPWPGNARELRNVALRDAVLGRGRETREDDPAAYSLSGPLAGPSSGPLSGPTSGPLSGPRSGPISGGRSDPLGDPVAERARLGGRGGPRPPLAQPIPVEAPAEAPAGAVEMSAWRLRHETRHARAATAVWRAGGNRAGAARALGVSRSTLYRWLGLPRLGEGPGEIPRDAARGVGESTAGRGTRGVPEGLPEVVPAPAWC